MHYFLEVSIEFNRFLKPIRSSTCLSVDVNLYTYMPDVWFEQWERLKQIFDHNKLHIKLVILVILQYTLYIFYDKLRCFLRDLCSWLQFKAVKDLLLTVFLFVLLKCSVNPSLILHLINLDQIKCWREYL